MSFTVKNNKRPEYDWELQDIADYVLKERLFSPEAMETARYCLMDTLGCGLLALQVPECTRHLGPVVPDTLVPCGSRVPGTDFRLDPVKAAWDIGCMIRWLDFNDTWLAAEWGHPSDNLGGILAVADYLSQQRVNKGQEPLTMKTVLRCMVMAHEIQGCLALENAFNRVGLDHVVLVKVASTAVVARLLGANRDQMLSALSHAWVDGQSLRTYRHAPNTGSRKSWAAGDATARAVQLAMIAMRGEIGIPGVLSAPQWGFYDVSFSKTNPCPEEKLSTQGKKTKGTRTEQQIEFSFQREYSSYVMENILFKISFPAEFHGQTACEAAVTLHGEIKGKTDQIDRIVITTHESAIRIIAKEGPLDNPADRDHCLQYMVAVVLLWGNLTADRYETSFHQDHPEIENLRNKMVIEESLTFSKDYLDPQKRSIPNALQVFFMDGSSTSKVTVEYPLGHRRRRKEGIPLLKEKFRNNLKSRFTDSYSQQLIRLFDDQKRLEALPVTHFMEQFTGQA
ncbi:2-methylcitrate dehydratase [invertebrate metagenome]|uniref:2-methylcitrate dehydratase n=1 Tax=invertebrate metagenome TaxID=1711999 RepID=A0A2H9T741_9ZZZZ